MTRRLLLLSALVLAGCTKKPEGELPKKPSTQEQPRRIAPDESCAEFGRTMRSLAFRDAAHRLRRSAPESCRAQWGSRLDLVAQSFWLRMDCTKPETKALVDLHLATPTELRSNAEQFPNDPKTSVSVAAFLDAAAPVIRTTSDEILRLARELGDGGCELPGPP